ncbi:MAG TPA: hypothetical protein DD490_14700 [Acidobacteria bacterium]|nr:hypothetical protein [Acidobacteriota bacterium]
MIPNLDLWTAVLPVVDALEALGVPYHVGGSIASSFLGIARATQDADLVAALRPEHATPFTQALTGTFYADPERIANAIRSRKSFNVIHLGTAYKVDVFVSKDTAFAHANMARRVTREVPGLERSLSFSAAEDIVLHKLLWYAEGGGVSDRQWYDLQGVLRLQAKALDRAYLHLWADRLGVSGLLQRAEEEAGLGEG